MTRLDEEYVKKNIESLDDKFPELPWTQEELWDKIDARLTSPKTFKLNYGWYGVAASLIIGLILINYFLRTPISKESITYAVSNELEVPYTVVETDELDIQTLAFIKESCLKELEACNTIEFKELKDQLDETAHEIANLNNMIAQYGDSPELVKSKIKIENFRSEVMRQLVQIITS